MQAARRLSWLIAPAVFVVFFATYSFRLGIEPALMHDDFEYTYPSFSLAEHGNFGSPLLGPGLNIENRTYNLIVYYYASVHAVLIRLFGDAAQSVPLANTFHFALLAAAGVFFFLRREAFAGAALFLCLLVTDGRMVEAARHGRPEITAGCCLTLGLIALWLFLGEGRRRPVVLFGMSAAFTAGLLSHTAMVFFVLAIALVFAVPLLRQASRRDLAAGLVPVLVIPLLYGYFILTDRLSHLRDQIAPSQGNVVMHRVLLPLLDGDWQRLCGLALEFWRGHAGSPWLWLGVLAALLLPAVFQHPSAWGARFFAAVYSLFVVVHFVCLKPLVPSYRAIYQAALYVALGLLLDAVSVGVGQRLGRASWARALRLAVIAGLLVVCAATMGRFRAGLLGQPQPFARLEGALRYALMESGAHAGDRVFVPSPFGFHLRRTFDVIAYPAPKYSIGRWSVDFRDGVRRIWGPDVPAQVDLNSLCDAMWLAFAQPKWVVTWDADYSSLQPFYAFLRRYPDLPGMEVTRGKRAVLPAPYGGTVRVYRLGFSDEMVALDHSLKSTRNPCP